MEEILMSIFAKIGILTVFTIFMILIGILFVWFLEVNEVRKWYQDYKDNSLEIVNKKACETKRELKR